MWPPRWPPQTTVARNAPVFNYCHCANVTQVSYSRPNYTVSQKHVWRLFVNSADKLHSVFIRLYLFISRVI